METEIIDKKKRQILVFNLLEEPLGLDVSSVCEVLKPQEIHPLPQAPEFIEGVINLRGHIIAVMDLRKRFNIKAAEDRPDERIIICKINSLKKFIVGIIVDSVTEVVDIEQENIEVTPELVSMQIQNCYISGIARVKEKVIVILNVEKILTGNEITQLTKIKE